MLPKISTRQELPGGAGGGAGVDPVTDRLSDLPDALLHHIMSFMKAWEVVRTCVLSRRWRDLWASAPCIDVRLGWYGDHPEDFDKFVYRLLLSREALAPVHTLRLGQPDDLFDIEDAKIWLCYAIKRNARVIQLKGARNLFLKLDPMDFVSRHLKVLKLSYANVDDKFVSKLPSGCPNLEELHLKGCLVEAREILSASLKKLIMVKCAFTPNFTVDCPNLVVLRCIAPHRCIPLFKKFGSLVTGSVMLDDSLFIQKHSQEDEFSQTSDEDGDNDSIHSSDDSGEDEDNGSIHTSDDSDDSNDDCDYYNDYSYDNEYRYDYGSDNYSDTDTLEYSEVANGYEDGQFTKCDYGPGSSNSSICHDHNAKCATSDDKKSGVQNVLHSLSNAKSLELLGYSGEVILRTEAVSCPTFSNLKILALGEWCISAGADFDILVILLQHSPNLQRLNLQLDMNIGIQKALRTNIQPKGGSFYCKHLCMVKIRCTKDDPRVHMLAQLFRSNGVPLEKIYVCRARCFCLGNMKFQRAMNFTICEPH